MIPMNGGDKPCEKPCVPGCHSSSVVLASFTFMSDPLRGLPCSTASSLLGNVHNVTIVRIGQRLNTTSTRLFKYPQASDLECDPDGIVRILVWG